MTVEYARTLLANSDEVVRLKIQKKEDQIGEISSLRSLEFALLIFYLKNNLQKFFNLILSFFAV